MYLPKEMATWVQHLKQPTPPLRLLLLCTLVALLKFEEQVGQEHLHSAAYEGPLSTTTKHSTAPFSSLDMRCWSACARYSAVQLEKSVGSAGARGTAQQKTHLRDTIRQQYCMIEHVSVCPCVYILW